MKITNDIFFLQQKQIFSTKMLQQHLFIYNLLQEIPETKRFLVTTHDAFNYFTRAYLSTPQDRMTDQWILRCQAPEGLAPDSQISTLDIERIIQYLIKYNILLKSRILPYILYRDPSLLSALGRDLHT